MNVLPGVLGPRTLRRTVQVRLGFKPLRLPGGTLIFTVSQRQFVDSPGWCSRIRLTASLKDSEFLTIRSRNLSFPLLHCQGEDGQEFPQKYHLRPWHRGRLLHNEQLNPTKAGFEM
jgi:hypothetical protein